MADKPERSGLSGTSNKLRLGWQYGRFGLRSQHWTAQMHQAVAIEDLGSTPYVSFDGSPVSSGRTALAFRMRMRWPITTALHLELELECGDPSTKIAGSGII